MNERKYINIFTEKTKFVLPNELCTTSVHNKFVLPNELLNLIIIHNEHVRYKHNIYIIFKKLNRYFYDLLHFFKIRRRYVTYFIIRKYNYQSSSYDIKYKFYNKLTRFNGPALYAYSRRLINGHICYNTDINLCHVRYFINDINTTLIDENGIHSPSYISYSDYYLQQQLINSHGNNDNTYLSEIMVRYHSEVQNEIQTIVRIIKYQRHNIYHRPTNQGPAYIEYYDKSRQIQHELYMKNGIVFRDDTTKPCQIWYDCKGNIISQLFKSVYKDIDTTSPQNKWGIIY